MDTKFIYQQLVWVTSGFYRGLHGRCVERSAPINIVGSGPLGLPSYRIENVSEVVIWVSEDQLETIDG